MLPLVAAPCPCPQKTVLVVDDEPGVRFMLLELVRSWGHQAVAASSGCQALAMLHAADAVITDLCMPGMDGLELTARIRAICPALPVIVVSAFCDERMRGAVLAKGAFAAASKPFDIDELGAAIERALAGPAR